MFAFTLIPRGGFRITYRMLKQLVNFIGQTVIGKNFRVYNKNAFVKQVFSLESNANSFLVHKNKLQRQTIDKK